MNPMADPRVIGLQRYDKALQDKRKATDQLAAADKELNEVTVWLKEVVDLNTCWVLGDIAFIKDTNLNVRRVDVIRLG